MYEDISKERKAFLVIDYSRGFIEYCRIKTEIIKKSCFQSYNQGSRFPAKHWSMIFSGVITIGQCPFAVNHSVFAAVLRQDKEAVISA